MFDFTHGRPRLKEVCGGCCAAGTAIAMGAATLLLVLPPAQSGFEGREDARLFHRGDQLGVFR